MRNVNRLLEDKSAFAHPGNAFAHPPITPDISIAENGMKTIYDLKFVGPMTQYFQEADLPDPTVAVNSSLS